MNNDKRKPSQWCSAGNHIVRGFSLTPWIAQKPSNLLVSVCGKLYENSRRGEGGCWELPSAVVFAKVAPTCNFFVCVVQREGACPQKVRDWTSFFVRLVWSFFFLISRPLLFTQWELYWRMLAFPRGTGNVAQRNGQKRCEYTRYIEIYWNNALSFYERQEKSEETCTNSPVWNPFSPSPGIPG